LRIDGIRNFSAVREALIEFSDNQTEGGVVGDPPKTLGPHLTEGFRSENGEQYRARASGCLILELYRRPSFEVPHKSSQLISVFRIDYVPEPLV